MSIATPTINSFIDQLRFRIETKEALFKKKLDALKGAQAARGLLKSGSTIRQSLDAMAADFKSTIDEALEYLGKVMDRSDLDARELFQATAELLTQSVITFKSIVQPDQLISINPTKGVSDVVANAFDELDRILTLNLREFAEGLHDSSPRRHEAIVPAAGRYVTLQDNEKERVESELEALKHEVRGSNEQSEEERLVALSEIAAFEAAIVQSRVSTDLIQRFVDAVLKWITTKFTGAVIGVIATRLIEALLPFLAQ